MRHLVMLLLALVLAACAGKGPAPTPSAPPTPVPPTATAEPPTPARPGQAAAYDGLELAVMQAELSGSYTSEYGTPRQPGENSQYAWVRVDLKNSSGKVRAAPDPDHFSVLYFNQEQKPSYGHRKDYPDYYALDSGLSPGEQAGAWLRFEVPAAAQLGQLTFVYMPESIQFSPLAPNAAASWANHPVFLWQLGP